MHSSSENDRDLPTEGCSDSHEPVPRILPHKVSTKDQVFTARSNLFKAPEDQDRSTFFVTEFSHGSNLTTSRSRANGSLESGRLSAPKKVSKGHETLKSSPTSARESTSPYSNGISRRFRVGGSLNGTESEFVPQSSRSAVVQREFLASAAERIRTGSATRKVSRTKSSFSSMSSGLTKSGTFRERRGSRRSRSNSCWSQRGFSAEPSMADWEK